MLELVDNINHNNNIFNKYNPDKFRNFYMPDTAVANRLPYGSAILGTHKFPEELLTSTKPFSSVP